MKIARVTNYMGIGALAGFVIVSMDNKTSDNLLYTHFFTFTSGLLIVLWATQKIATQYIKELSDPKETIESLGTSFHNQRKGGDVKILHIVHIMMLIFGTLLVFDSSDYIFSSTPLFNNDVTLMKNPIKTFGITSSMLISLALAAIIQTIVLFIVRNNPD